MQNIPVDLTVLLDFTSNPADPFTHRYWQDVSDDVYSVSVDRGRDFELDAIEAGVCRLRINNTSGDYDPTNVDGPYYPNVLPLRKCMLGMGYGIEVAKDHPICHWRLGELTGADAVDESASCDGAYVGGPLLGQAGLLSGSENTSVDFNGLSQYVNCSNPASASLNSGSLSAEAWVYPHGVTDFAGILHAGGATGAYNYSLDVTGGNLVATIYTGTGSTALVSASTSISASTTTYAAFSWDHSNGMLKLYKNGALAASASAAASGANTVPATYLWIGKNASGYFNGTLDEVAIYDEVLSADRIAAHYTEGTTGEHDTTLFMGFIESWPQSFKSNREAKIDVTATDAFLLFANIELPSAYEVDVLNDNPRVYYRLDEETGTICFDSSGNGYDGTYTGNATAYSASGICNDSGKSIDFQHDPPNGTGIVLTEAARIPPIHNSDGTLNGLELTLEAWIQTTLSPYSRDGSYYGNIYVQDCSPIPKPTPPSGVGLYWDFFRFGLGPTGNLVGIAGHATYGGSFKATTTQVNDGLTHHVAMTFTVSGATGTTHLYVDGAEVSAPDTPTAYTDSVSLQAIGRHQKSAYTSDYFDGLIDNFAIYETALSADRIAAHYNSGNAPWSGDRTDERISRILDFIGWPTNMRDLDAGISTLPAEDNLKGNKALAYMQKIALTENGSFYIDSRGMAIFRNRHATLTDDRSTIVQATFGDGGDTELPYEDIDFDYDVDLIRNFVTISDAGGNTISAKDQTSIDTYFKRTYSRDVLIDDIDESQAAAEWLVQHYKDPSLRVRKITLAPRSDSDLWHEVLTREIGDLLLVRRRTPSGNLISQRVLIEGVSHNYDTKTHAWRTTYTLSPVSSQAYMVLGKAADDYETTLYAQTNQAAPLEDRTSLTTGQPLGTIEGDNFTLEEGASFGFANVAPDGQIIVGTFPYSDNQLNSRGNTQSYVSFDPVTNTWTSHVVPTTSGALATSGFLSDVGGADVSDVIIINVSATGEDYRPALISAVDYTSWQMSTYGRYNAWLVLTQDTDGNWIPDTSLSRTVDQLAASDPDYGTTAFESRTNLYSETYRRNPGFGEAAVLPDSGHAVIGAYFYPTGAYSGSFHVIDPTTSNQVAYYAIPDCTGSDGTVISLSPRDMQAEYPYRFPYDAQTDATFSVCKYAPAGTGYVTDERFVVIYDTFIRGATGSYPFAFQEFAYHGYSVDSSGSLHATVPASARIEPISAPILLPDDNIRANKSAFLYNGALVVAVGGATGLSAFAAKDTAIFAADNSPDSGNPTRELGVVFHDDGGQQYFQPVGGYGERSYVSKAPATTGWAVFSATGNVTRPVPSTGWATSYGVPVEADYRLGAVGNSGKVTRSLIFGDGTNVIFQTGYTGTIFPYIAEPAIGFLSSSKYIDAYDKLSNPTFESDVSGWAGDVGSASVAWDSGNSGRLKMTCTGPPYTVANVTTPAGTGGFAIAEADWGQSFNADFFVQCTGTARTFRAGVQFYDSRGDSLGGVVYGPTMTGSVSAEVTCKASAIVPQNSYYARALMSLNSPATGEIHYVNTAHAYVVPVVHLDTINLDITEMDPNQSGSLFVRQGAFDLDNSYLWQIVQQTSAGAAHQTFPNYLYRLEVLTGQTLCQLDHTRLAY